MALAPSRVVVDPGPLKTSPTASPSCVSFTFRLLVALLVRTLSSLAVLPMINYEDHAEEQLKFLSVDEQEVGEELQELQARVRSRSSHPYVQYTAFAIIIALLLIDITIRVQLSIATCPAQDTERAVYFIGNGTERELAAARAVITYSPRNMTGLYEYSTTTKRITRKKDAETEYIGPPSAELDQNWGNLLEHDLNALLDSEIAPYQHVRDQDRWPDRAIHFEPEVYHVLHCLNAVREKVNRVIYPEKEVPQAVVDLEETLQETFSEITDNWQRLHIEHCMDRIRQDIMCHADLTPSIFSGIDELPVSLLLSQPSERICRDWKPIQSWMEGRKRIDRQVLEMGQAQDT